MPNETSEIFALAAQYFLKEYKEAGGSQTGLAKELGVTNAYISSVVNGSRSASFDLYTQIAKELYGPLDKFLTIGRRIKNGLPPLPEEKSGSEDEAEHLITRLAYYILDHRRIAKEIKELKQFYESIVENLQSAVLVMDSNNEVVFSNKQLESICGVRPDDVIGTTPFNFEKTIPWCNTKPFVQSYNEAFGQLKPIYYENINFTSSEGASRHISGWLIPLLNENDKFHGMICTLRDTSDAFATFNLLVETVEHIQDAVVILQQSRPGKTPNAFFANKNFRQIFCLDEINPFSLPFDKLVSLITEKITNKKEWQQFISKTIKENTASTTFVFNHINGKKYFAHGKPINDKQGVQVGRIATLKEVK